MKIIFLILFAISINSFASIEVAFIEIRSQDNKVIQLEPGGQFAHLAISYHGKWLHSYPPNGVEIIPEEALERIGIIKTVVVVSEIGSISDAAVNYFLGRPYDLAYSWSDDRIYCSELIAKILMIEPEPMEFKSKFWPEKYKILKGNLGLSPDDIFKSLKSKGYRSYNMHGMCIKLFI